MQRSHVFSEFLQRKFRTDEDLGSRKDYFSGRVRRGKGAFYRKWRVEFGQKLYREQGGSINLRQHLTRPKNPLKLQQILTCKCRRLHTIYIPQSGPILIARGNCLQRLSMQLQAYKAAITDIEGVKCQFVQRVWREIGLLREGGLLQADAVEGDILSDFEGLAQAAGAGDGVPWVTRVTPWVKIAFEGAVLEDLGGDWGACVGGRRGSVRTTVCIVEM